MRTITDHLDGVNGNFDRLTGVPPDDLRLMDAESSGPPWSDPWLRAILRFAENADPADYQPGTMAQWVAATYHVGDPLPDLDSEAALVDIIIGRDGDTGLPYLGGILAPGAETEDVGDHRIVCLRLESRDKGKPSMEIVGFGGQPCYAIRAHGRTWRRYRIEVVPQPRQDAQAGADAVTLSQRSRLGEVLRRLALHREEGGDA